MKYTKFLLPLILFILLAFPAWAQRENPYELTWFGFGTSGFADGGPYVVHATLVQLENSQSNGGIYTLEGRLSNGVGVTITPLTTTSKLYLPIVHR